MTKTTNLVSTIKSMPQGWWSEKVEDVCAIGSLHWGPLFSRGDACPENSATRSTRRKWLDFFQYWGGAVSLRGRSQLGLRNTHIAPPLTRIWCGSQIFIKKWIFFWFPKPKTVFKNFANQGGGGGWTFVWAVPDHSDVCCVCVWKSPACTPRPNGESLWRKSAVFQTSCRTLKIQHIGGVWWVEGWKSFCIE